MAVRKDNTSRKEREREFDGSAIGEQIINGLRDFRDTLRDGVPIQERFTMRTVDLNLEPRDYSSERIRHVREALHASQAVFAQLIGVSAKTLQAWEQGNQPNATARRLLEIMEDDPEPWIQRLRDAMVERESA